MWKCNSCGLNKPFAEYNFKIKSLGIRQKTCKNCTRQQIRNHYYKNRQYYLDKTRKRNNILRKKLREYIWDYLQSHPCVDCGENDPIVLEFDHQHDKKMNVSHMVDYHLDIVQKEIFKCVVRCANCHRRKTSNDLGWFKK